MKGKAHYSDPTAREALGNVTKEEKEKEKRKKANEEKNHSVFVYDTNLHDGKYY